MIEVTWYSELETPSMIHVRPTRETANERVWNSSVEDLVVSKQREMSVFFGFLKQDCNYLSCKNYYILLKLH